MAAKNIENVTGLVERVSDKGTGIKVGGEWLNVSQFHAIELPQPGLRVDVEIERTERSAWIQSVRVLDGGKVYPLPQQGRRGGGGGRTPAEQREIRRMSVLKAAAEFGASRPDMKSTDVLTVADRWLAWLEQPEQKGGDFPA